LLKYRVRYRAIVIELAFTICESELIARHKHHPRSVSSDISRSPIALMLDPSSLSKQLHFPNFDNVSCRCWRSCCYLVLRRCRTVTLHPLQMQRDVDGFRFKAGNIAIEEPHILEYPTRPGPGS
jgi:hypothetical protein